MMIQLMIRTDKNFHAARMMKTLTTNTRQMSRGVISRFGTKYPKSFPFFGFPFIVGAVARNVAHRAMLEILYKYIRRKHSV